MPGDGLALAAAVLGPLLLYAASLPRTVVLEDDGLFLMAGAELGIAHPPGYPLYTLICHLFMQLPFGGPALLGHLSSAALGALACGALYLCARLLGAAKLPALTAAWLFGASEHFWSQATIAEVYTLNALLFFAAYGLILHGVRQPRRIWPWAAAAAAYGLSLANHWPLMALALPGLALAAWPARKWLLPKLPLLFAVALASASLPYAWMVARSLQEPFISFYGPIADWDAFWHYVSRSGYAEEDANPIAGWGDRLAFLGWFGQQAFWQLTPPGFALAVLGLFALLKRRRLLETAAAALVFLSNSLVLILLLEFEFDFHRIAIFRPYSLVCYGLLALWLAVGLTFALQRLPAWTARLFRSQVRSQMRGAAQSPGIPIAAALAGLGLLAWAVLMHWPLNDRADGDFTARYAQTLFALLPNDAMLIVRGDAPTSVLGYQRFVAQRRPDIELRSLSGLVYGNRLYDPLLSEPRRQDILRRHLAASGRPVFYAADDEDFPHGYGIRHHGFLKEADKAIEPGTLHFAFSPAAAQYFEELLERRPIDRWERFLQLTLLHVYGQFLGYVVLLDDAELLQQTQQQRMLAERSFSSLVGMSEVLLKYGGPSHWPQLGAWLAKAEPRLDPSFERWRRARFHHLKGVLLGRQGQEAPAVQAFRRSFAVHPDPANPSIEALELHGIKPGR